MRSNGSSGWRRKDRPGSRSRICVFARNANSNYLFGAKTHSPQRRKSIASINGSRVPGLHLFGVQPRRRESSRVSLEKRRLPHACLARRYHLLLTLLLAHSIFPAIFSPTVRGHRYLARRRAGSRERRRKFPMHEALGFSGRSIQNASRLQLESRRPKTIGDD